MAILSLKLTPTSSSFFPACKQKPFTSKSLIQCCKDTNSQLGVSITALDNRLASFPEKNLIIGNPTATILPPRPRQIILVRYGQSEVNVNEIVYTKVVDSKIALTEKGMAEVEENGRRIKAMIENDGVDDWQVYFYVLPYRRMLDTLWGLAKAFKRSRIDRGERRATSTRARFWWYKWTVQLFEGLDNLGNGNMIVMEKGYGGRYSLSMHHIEEELRKFGLIDEMLIDQEWLGELNYDSLTIGPSFFTPFDDEDNNT